MRTKNAFDAEYADDLYDDYNNRINDSETKQILKEVLSDHVLMLMAPGHSVLDKKT